MYIARVTQDDIDQGICVQYMSAEPASVYIWPNIEEISREPAENIYTLSPPSLKDYRRDKLCFDEQELHFIEGTLLNKGYKIVSFK